MQQRDFMTNQSKERHAHEFEMQFLSRESSRRHVEMQEGLLEQTIRKESSRLLGKKESSKHPIIEPQAFDPEGGEDMSGQLLSRQFVFSFWSYLGQTALAYGLLIGLCYLIKAGSFPYFQLLFVFGLMISVSPWTLSNLLLLTAGIIVICNNYLKVAVLTYPAIIICYLSVMLFNEKNKQKIIFIFCLVCVMAWGFAFIPGLYTAFSDDTKTTFYYIFPVFMVILRLIISGFYMAIKYSELVFLQLPFFILGLQYGVILTLQTGQIEYWYLMVCFTLEIINDRTQFLLRMLISIFQTCRNTIDHRQEFQDDGNDSRVRRDIKILAAHASGYSCVHSFHIICVIYIFTRLKIYSSPYTSDTFLSAYTQIEWYIPLTTWALVIVYEIMCLVHERKHRDKLLIGHTNNSIPYTILRGVMLTLGFWMFYLGLGIGNFIFYPENTRTTST